MQLTEGVDYLHGQGLFHGNLTAVRPFILVFATLSTHLVTQ